MESREQCAFQRAKFDPLGRRLDRDDKIRSLPDLINFNAEVNPHHLFCIQASARSDDNSENPKDKEYRSTQISFRNLKHAVDACSSWLEKNVLLSVGEGETRSKPAPVALYLESDISLFIYIAALLTLGVPTVLLSARLSVESVRHLLKETGSSSILLSKRTERLIARDVVDLAAAELAPDYSLFLDSLAQSTSSDDNRYSSRMEVDEDDTDVLILHSSGTTGLPKPIRLAHRYLLGYSACHSFPTEKSIVWKNFSTLPLYHGFGLLAPCLSLSVGMPCVFPPHNIIPAAHSTLDLLLSFGVQSMMTVPSILEDILSFKGEQREKALSSLRRMRLVAVGGGPLSPDALGTLVADGVKVLNHYGATEIGAIAPIFEPDSDYDARYLRLRTDLGLQLHPVVGTEGKLQRFKLIGYPFGWAGKPFEIQDELVKRPCSAHMEVQILGRRDDLVVLKNGEKVDPRYIEQTLAQDHAIKTAVCLGQGKVELAVLVEPATSIEDVEGFVDYVWQQVSERINPSLDAHAQISSKRAIIVKPGEKAIPRSDKGSVMRREVYSVFDEEIRTAYEALDVESFASSVKLDIEQLESSISELIKQTMQQKLSNDWDAWDDLFELGMDSLQATLLARSLNTSILKASPDIFDITGRLTPAFIYQNPSLAKLTSAVGLLIRDHGGEDEHGNGDRASQMQTLVEECLHALENTEDFLVADSLPGTSDGITVLLTGSTGNLGAHMLNYLARSNNISGIICLNRQPPGNSMDCGLRFRQEEINASAGVALSDAEWKKISFLGSNTQASNLGLTRDQLAQLGAVVTHIVHLAWPMDFNRQLSSFRPQLNALNTLIRLATSAHRARPHLQPPRLLLASSISVVRHHHEQTGSHVVPEAPLDNPLTTAPMGYAEAKWVCERILQRVAEGKKQIAPIIVRIGQISGPEGAPGIWKTVEHMPALIKASQMLSAFPELKGNYSWLPVDRAARSLVDILFHDAATDSIYYHLENPIRQPLSALGTFVADELGLKERCVPFEVWLERLAATSHVASLMSFFRNDFEALASGNVVLGTPIARAASIHLRGSGGVSKDLIVEYLRRWKASGFLAY